MSTNKPLSIRIELVEQDEDVYEYLVDVAGTRITMITLLNREDDRIVLSKLHIDGPGPNSSSPRMLLLAARELGLVWGVSEVRIEGAVRTTGARPGHRPRPIVVRVEPEE